MLLVAFRIVFVFKCSLVLECLKVDDVKYFVKVIAFKDDVTKSPYQLASYRVLFFHSQAGTGTALLSL